MRRRLALALGVLLCVGALAAFALTLPIAFRDDSAAVQAQSRAASQGEARSALSAGLAALREGDEAAWRAALPARGHAARQARLELWRRLSPLPWTDLAASVQPVLGQPGRFDVRLLGELAGVGPADRIVAERVFEFQRVIAGGSRTVITADETPPALRSAAFMAFRHPVATKGGGCVVVSDTEWGSTARQLANAATAGRRRLAALGLRPDRPVMVFLYGSEAQLKASLGDAPEQRIKYFSSPVDRYPAASWWPRDVGVLGPAIDGQKYWMPNMLAHELTHAFTFRWFDDTKHAPLFLLEGLATAVEGGRSYQALRDEIATGNKNMPLLTTMALGSFWSGHDIGDVHLAYYEAGSVVQYVLSGWGLATLRQFAAAVADSDLTDDGIKAAVERSLHLTWPEFVGGWEAYVQTLP